MTHYYGVIVDLLTRSTDSIEGDHPYKPTVEHGGMFCTCHWFKSELLALQFEVGTLEIFRSMDKKGMKKLVEI